MIFIITVAIILAACIIGLIICLYLLCYKIPKDMKRNEDVYNFSKNTLNNHYELYHLLPDYNTMLKDGKPLKLESYIPKDKIK